MRHALTLCLILACTPVLTLAQAPTRAEMLALFPSQSVREQPRTIATVDARAVNQTASVRTERPRYVQHGLFVIAEGAWAGCSIRDIRSTRAGELRGTVREANPVLSNADGSFNERRAYAITAAVGVGAAVAYKTLPARRTLITVILGVGAVVRLLLAVKADNL